MEVGQRIKSLRLQLGLSQEELAKKVGYKDRTSIAKVEGGKVDLTQSKFKAFADGLGTTPAYLMGLEDDSKHNLTNDINPLQFKHWEKDFGLQVIVEDKTLNLSTLSPEQKMDILRFIRFVINEEK